MERGRGGDEGLLLWCLREKGRGRGGDMAGSAAWVHAIEREIKLME